MKFKVEMEVEANNDGIDLIYRILMDTFNLKGLVYKFNIERIKEK